MEEDLKLKQQSLHLLDVKLVDANELLLKKLNKNEYLEEVRKIWKNFDKFWEFQNLADFEGKINPIVKQCKQKVNEWVSTCIENKSIIKRFDEVLCEKASKFSIDQLRREIDSCLKSEDLDKILEDSKAKYSELFEKFREVDQTIFLIETNLSEELAEAMKKLDQEIKHKMLKEIGGKPLDKKEIMAMIECKVNKNDLYTSLKSKVGREDLFKFHGLIGKLHAYLKHVVVFSQEFLRLNIAQSTLTEHEIINLNANLSAQLKDIFKWVCDLDKELLMHDSNVSEKSSNFKDLKPLNLKNLKNLKLPSRASYLLNKGFRRNSCVNLSMNSTSNRNIPQMK